MNPYDEKRLRDEVIYLHYLWHQGPPQNPDPNPRKRPRPLSQFPTYNSQRVAASGSCPTPEPDSGADWSALVHTQPPSPSGWPEPNSKTDHQITQPVSVEDQASELRGYYEENHEKDAEPNKGTVNEQHSTAISKTKRKRAHRAFGLVICDIIGWDIVCLPSIVLKSQPVEDLSEFPLDGRACGNKDESGAAMDKRDSESASKEDVDPNHNSSVNSENSMNGEASKGNDLENRTSNTSANQEKAVDSLNSPLENNNQPRSDDILAESSSVPEPKEDAHNLQKEPSSNPETM
ncbi:hypothetical protein CCACVL1_16480 [Corchorus capsularis]|uniref:Uncharacterized protein n=1 Tax=Corchorus capsularis TaxID=210143 RepID=A0A1R3HWK9_COCAP|nr:hypothetical protein CCACVL1_16480 [Corchorus capsularis]